MARATSSVRRRDRPEGAIGAATRARLVAATAKCIRKYGIAKTGVADIVREAGASRQTAYHYFNGRRDLIRHALRQEAGRFIERIPDAVADRSEPLDVLVGIALFLFQEVPRDPALSTIFTPGALESLQPVADAPDTLLLAKATLGPYERAVGGVEDEDLAALAELMNRLIFSAMLDPEDALLAVDDAARAKLERWLTPIVEHHLRSKRTKKGKRRARSK